MHELRSVAGRCVVWLRCCGLRLPLASPRLTSPAGLLNYLQILPPLQEVHHGPASLLLHCAGLRCLDLQHNDLRQLPAALTACTALTCLSLDYNWRMLLRQRDLDTLRVLCMLRTLDAVYVKDEEPGFCRSLHALLPALRIRFRASNLVTPTWGL